MDWISEHLWESWLIAAGVLGLLELVSLDLIFAMLAGGALVGALAAALAGSVPLSVVMMLVASVALLGFLRPSVMKKVHNGPALRTGHQTLIGREGVIIEAIEAGGSGRVKVDGQDWLAVAYDQSEQVAIGRRVDIIEITGATAHVMPIPELGSDKGSEE